MNRSVLKNTAKENLTGKFGKWLIIILIPSIVVGILYAASGVLVESSNRFFVFFGICVYIAVFFISIVLDALYTFASVDTLEKPYLNVGNLLDDVFGDASRIIVSQLLMGLFIFLWSLLLIVPGIMKAYSYRMTMYLIKQHPDLTPMEAIQLSEKLMKGNRLNLFVLDLSFILWQILATITFGLALIYVIPYMNTTHVVYFKELEKDQPYVYTN
ncbi:DUF975 family protein [Vagococcus humatus]|uniref:DUF975 domain-containing protein n=1 Tax=Vagococcus humatus TaxID=1889241 RepID=A0A429Z886_9ENTE|nr:DUF975 family protein [Vagococcus humatus]RST89927.1 hypothetical protein C7P63_02285 [Vagococcus humatus]